MEAQEIDMVKNFWVFQAMNKVFNLILLDKIRKQLDMSVGWDL